MKIESQIRLGLGLQTFDTQTIKDEPMFFNASALWAMEFGGPITREFFNSLQWDTGINLDEVVFDSRVHMLMPGFFPCIPGFHHDDVPDRDEALRNLLEMTYMRSQLTFTRSTVVAGDPVDWDSPEVYPALREVVNYCIEAGAYKPFMGVTAGHFTAKIGETEFLTSRRKTNFNNLPSTGLVRVKTDGPDKVVAMGSKPSVGGQSQRIVFDEHPELDCIVHFHCPIKEGSLVPRVSQREFECGSHECGQNTSSGLGPWHGGEIEAVYLENHGPNIFFHHDTDPKFVIRFIEDNFDLKAKTGGNVT